LIAELTSLQTLLFEGNPAAGDCIAVETAEVAAKISAIVTTPSVPACSTD